MTAKVLLRAKYDFAAADTEELPLKAGDIISLLFKDESGWAKGVKTSGEKGWFPIEYVDLANDVNTEDFVVEENVAAKIPDSERPRYNIVSEMLQTEKTYLKNIIKIVKSFMTPLKDGSIIETKSIPKIFANIEEIYNLNTKLFLELEGRVGKWNETQLIGDAFSSAFDGFGAYEEYLKSHHTAILTVNALREQKKNFAIWLNTMKDQKESEGLDLLAYLIMPVQRILRYKLLLEDLLKNTKPEHPDFANIGEALKKIGDLAVSVNESIKEEENYQTLLRIQKGFMGNVKNIVIEGRNFVREGPVMKVCRKTDKPRWFFLFSDVLVYASAAVGSLSRKSVAPPRQSLVVSGTMGKRLLTQEDANQKFLYHRMIPLKTTKVKALEDTLSCKNAFQIITTEEKSFVVYTETPQEKDAWIRDITKFSSVEDLSDSAAPIWIPDREAKTCMTCAKAFNVVNRRHHCRYCGKVVCGACSPQSIKIPSLSQKPVRVCKICYEDFKKGELKDAKWEGSRESYGIDSDISRSSSARNSMISNTGLDLESDSETSETESPRDSLNKPRMGTNSSTRSLKEPPSRTVSSPNLGNEEKSRESGNFPIVTASTSADSATSPVQTTPITSPNGTPTKVPPKPVTAKPPVKPKPTTMGESDLIKKRIEYLAKTLEDETNARLAQEKNFQVEITELRRENAQLREELEDIKLRILPILEKAAQSQ